MTVDGPRALGRQPHATTALSTALHALLDGTRPWDAVWGELLVEGFDAGQIAGEIEALERRGLLEDPDHGHESVEHRDQILLLEQLAPSQGTALGNGSWRAGRELLQRLSSTTIAVLATRRSLADDIGRALLELGIGKVATHETTDIAEADAADGDPGRGRTPPSVVESAVESLKGSPHAIAICASDSGGDALAETVNRACVSAGIMAVYYRCRGLAVELGPLVIPGQTACYTCYRLRREAAMAPWERALVGAASDPGRLRHALGADWLAIEVLKLVTGVGEPVARGRILRIDYLTGLPEVHRILRVPRCGVCGSGRQPARQLWEEPVSE